jgi:hypothetical protein
VVFAFKVGVRPRTVKAHGFQTHGLRKFEFKAWIISSASVFAQDAVQARPCLMIPVVVVALSTRCLWVRVRRARLRDFPSTESRFRISHIGNIQRKTALRAPIIT